MNSPCVHPDTLLKLRKVNLSFVAKLPCQIGWRAKNEKRKKREKVKGKRMKGKRLKRLESTHIICTVHFMTKDYMKR